MFRRISAIARTTLLEAVRNRVFGVLVLFACGMIGFSTVLGALSLHEEVRIVKDLGLAATSLFGVLISLFLGVNLLAKELDKKTVYAILSKPIERWEFLIGKYLGLVATIAMLVFAMSIIMAILIQLEGGEHGIALMRAELLVFFELMLLIALALLFSSFSSPYLSAMFAGAIWLIGRNLSQLRALAESKIGDETLRATCLGMLRGVPDFELFYVSGANLDGEIVSIHDSFVAWSYVVESALYALSASALYLVIAVALFRRRDFI
jgi:ABC-type transport system involved in multi-copper enzyme maturation permease subunit